MSQARIDTLMRQLVGYVYPSAVSVGDDGHRFLRRWIVRCTRELPEQSALDLLAQRLCTEAQEAIRRAHGDRLAIEGSHPRTTADIVRISPRHCVASIESPAHDHAVGNEAAIGTWHILRGIDQAFELDELEGIPKQFWFQLRRLPEGE